MSYDNLASLILSRQCVLFAGSGLTRDGGGATWSELVEHLKTHFNYTTSITDEFRITQILCQKYGYDAVYSIIRERLKDAKIVGEKPKLIELPWFCFFTTNYDTAIEDTLKKVNPSSKIITIFKGDELALPGRPSESICIKLMGDINANYNDPGAMVLTRGELSKAMESRGKIYDQLLILAANLSFVFVGYSFKDELFLDILSRLKEDLGDTPHKYYAVFREEKPDDVDLAYLKEMGVETIFSNLDDFTLKLSNQINLLNPHDFRTKRIQIGNDLIPLEGSIIEDFFVEHEPVLYENLTETVSVNTFFKGENSSLLPFQLKWNYPRCETDSLLSKIENYYKKISNKNIFSINGNLGSGRTFIIRSAITEIIYRHRGIAFNIPSYSAEPIPYIQEFEKFLIEVELTTKKFGYEGPNLVVFWTEFRPSNKIIAEFQKLASYSPIPICLIFEDYETADIENDESSEIVNIKVEERVLNDKKEFSNYLIKLINDQKLARILPEEIEIIVQEERNYLPIMYRLIDPTRRSMNRMITEEYQILKNDPHALDCLAICSIASYAETDVPISILLKFLRNKYKQPFGYNHVFEYTRNSKIFIKSNYYNYNYYYTIYHPLVARYLAHLIKQETIDEYLKILARISDIRYKKEADFISSILITYGMNCPDFSECCFSREGLLSAFIEIKEKQPARPIIHHLARLYHRIDQRDNHVHELLNEALIEPKEKYALVERVENIYTTIAHILWNQKKKDLIDHDLHDPEILEIIENLRIAQNSIEPNIHPYVVHANLLEEMCYHQKDSKRKGEIISEFINVINEALDLAIFDPHENLLITKMYLNFLHTLNPEEAKKMADNFFVNGDGTGYYILARKEYDENRKVGQALEHLNKAISVKNYPLEAISLLIEIILNHMSDPDYGMLLNFATKTSDIYGFTDTWKSAYNKAVIFAINGQEYPSKRYFKIARKKAPYGILTHALLFWQDGEHRKKFSGRISQETSVSEGRIHISNIKGITGDIFFDPRKQNEPRKLKMGMLVDFEMGFSLIGPIAFDVRPSQSR